jgi:hypothetical protein
MVRQQTRSPTSVANSIISKALVVDTHSNNFAAWLVRSRHRSSVQQVVRNGQWRMAQ